jgi:hypothetical protein
VLRVFFTLAMRYNLALHCKSHIYHKTPKRRILTYLSKCLICELLAIRVSVCVVYPCNVVSLVIYCANLKK